MQIKHKHLWCSADNQPECTHMRHLCDETSPIAVTIDFRCIKINQYIKCSYSKIVFGFYRILKSTCVRHWQLANRTTAQIMHFRGFCAFRVHFVKTHVEFIDSNKIFDKCSADIVLAHTHTYTGWLAGLLHWAWRHRECMWWVAFFKLLWSMELHFFFMLLAMVLNSCAFEKVS